jgi:hypothetical protein
MRALEVLDGILTQEQLIVAIEAAEPDPAPR